MYYLIIKHLSFLFDHRCCIELTEIFTTNYLQPTQKDISNRWTDHTKQLNIKNHFATCFHFKMKTRRSCHHIWVDKLKYAGGSRRGREELQERSSRISYLHSIVQPEELYYDKQCKCSRNSQPEDDCRRMALPASLNVIIPSRTASLGPSSGRINSWAGASEHHHLNHTRHEPQHRAYHYHYHHPYYYTWCLLLAVFVAAITLQAPSAALASGQPPHINGTGMFDTSDFFV